MGIPDVVGLKLQDALQILEKSGLYTTPRIIQYFPPASKGLEQGYNLEERVIRQRMAEGQVELVVSRFRCCPPDLQPYKPAHGEEG